MSEEGGRRRDRQGGRILLYLTCGWLARADMELLIWRKKRERDRERGQLHSRVQGSDWETVRDPVQWWQEHSRQILNQ